VKILTTTLMMGIIACQQKDKTVAVAINNDKYYSISQIKIDAKTITGDWIDKDKSTIYNSVKLKISTIEFWSSTSETDDTYLVKSFKVDLLDCKQTIFISNENSKCD